MYLKYFVVVFEPRGPMRRPTMPFGQLIVSLIGSTIARMRRSARSTVAWFSAVMVISQGPEESELTLMEAPLSAWSCLIVEPLGPMSRPTIRLSHVNFLVGRVGGLMILFTRIVAFPTSSSSPVIVMIALDSSSGLS